MEITAREQPSIKGGLGPRPVYGRPSCPHRFDEGYRASSDGRPSLSGQPVTGPHEIVALKWTLLLARIQNFPGNRRVE